MPIVTRRRCWALAAAVGLVAGLNARGQDGASGDGPAGAGRVLDEKLTDRWKREAAEYRIVLHTKPETAPALRDEPALRWTNPVRETDDGLVWVWLSGGRPEAVACFYRAKLGGRTIEAHEFHSLATVPLTATRGGRTVWSPRGPGVTPRSHSGAPRPASTPSERLRQMRAWHASSKRRWTWRRGHRTPAAFSAPLPIRVGNRRGALRLRPDDRPGSPADHRRPSPARRPRLALRVRPHVEPQPRREASRPGRLGGAGRHGRDQPEQAVL